jgi:CheY-like chemotaxis protein
MSDLLVVDDDGDTRDVLVEVLTSMGHAVRTAKDGREGLAAVHSRYPDAILLDVEMPVLWGPGMAYGLLVHDAGAEHIPIILLSGIADLSRIAKLVGTPYCLQKPYALAHLTKILGRALTERTPPAPSEDLCGTTRHPATQTDSGSPPQPGDPGH